MKTSSELKINTYKKEITIRVSDYPGGVSLWGLFPPVYNTSKTKLEYGIHVHCRKIEDGAKVVDGTYEVVTLQFEAEHCEINVISITQEMAISYVSSQVLSISVSDVRCTHCHHPHLDVSEFSIKPHKKHTCQSCEKIFETETAVVGNPIAGIRKQLSQFTGNIPIIPSHTISIQQNDFASGIQLWGSNRSILWLRNKSEECGIHVHCYNLHEYRRVIDDTYAQVSVDGLELDHNMMRTYMAQCAMPFLRESVTSLECPKCKLHHYDTGVLAYTPHTEHTCTFCDEVFSSPEPAIGNPIKNILEMLGENTKLNKRWHYGMIDDNRITWSDDM